jgi:lectin-like protein
MRDHVAWALALGVPACRVADVDLDGRQCPCVPGWICDTPTNTCVRDPTLPDAEPADAAADAPPGTPCPSGYVAIAGLPSPSRYRFVATAVRWIDAELDCEDDADGTTLPSHLVVIDSAIEQTAVIGGELGGANIDDQWTGLTDLATEATWGYVTAQTPVFTDNPNGDQNDKDCVRLENNSSHEARDCDDTNRYACECDGLAGEPARYPNPPNGNP